MYPPNGTGELKKAIVLPRRLTRTEQIGNLRDGWEPGGVSIGNLRIKARLRYS